MKTKISGVLFSAIIGAIAFVAAPYVPMANSIVLALLIGIIVTNIFDLPKFLDTGINFSSKNLLETAIIFLGFGISFQDIANLGWNIVAILGVTILVVLIATF